MTARDRREIEVEVAEELLLAESSRPDDPIVAEDAAWRPSPAGVKAYEVRLESLREASEALDDLATDAAWRSPG